MFLDPRSPFSGSTPFRGSTAVSAGQLTPGVLRGPRFRRLFPDVYVDAATDITLALRARAAYLLVDGRGVVGGYAAAELLDASCGPKDAPVDLVVPGRTYRSRPGLVVHRGRLAPDEIDEVDGVAVTTAARTAYDLICSQPLVEAVVALDALEHRHEFVAATILGLHRRHLGARGSAQLPRAVELANRLAGSPMETRVRLVVVLNGLPVPVLQYPVGPYFLDLAYPGIKLAIEYDGEEHRTPERALHDLQRQAYLSNAGWKVLRFTATQVLRRPRWVAARIREKLIKAARRRGVGLDALDLY